MWVTILSFRAFPARRWTVCAGSARFLFPARAGRFPKKGINRARAAYLWQGTHNYKSPRQKILSLHAGDLLNLVIFYNYLRFADVTGR